MATVEQAGGGILQVKNEPTLACNGLKKPNRKASKTAKTHVKKH